MRSLFIACTLAVASRAQSATPPEPTLDQRVADVEAYINNSARTADVASRVAGPGPGHNGWMMTSAALVLFMTLPGLALFYGGLVRRKNVLSVLAQCMAITGVVTLLWWGVGYSLVFAPGTPYLGGLKYVFLEGVGAAPNLDYSAWISHSVWSMYQMMFAIITPALIIGAIAERMKFSAVVAFVILWMFAVYFPLAHMVWGVDGLMNGVWNGSAMIRAIDFAGGTVVHMSAGWSALVLCIILGPRIGFGKEPMAPHSMVLCMVGTGMLWVGWYGFNAGSAAAADGIAGGAFLATTLSAAIASLVWAGLEVVVFKKTSSILGMCSGAVSGLVVITPAAGFVSANGAVIIGVLAGAIPFLFCVKLKAVFGYDDALDTFGVHAVGGTLGALLTGLLANSSINANLTVANGYAKSNGLAHIVANGSLWIEQLKAIALTTVLSIVATIIIAYAIKVVMGLRASPEVERLGLDISEHNEEGYSL
ncbi:ammonium transporter [Rariglobus hedericola]|uniref:ammonium transporter n=1 Tax=Rariglobus hedericola TaxID=2597822 RepID=UPI0039EC8952